MKRFYRTTAIAAAFLVALSGCGAQESQPSPGTTPSAAAPVTNIKVVLDWTPNTNHTGLYVAKAKGYFAEQGLNVDIIQPGAGGADAMVASGAAEFGVSNQEGITLARTAQVPIVSIAAVIQHNTSGFASPQAKNITKPKDFEGKVYGGWGSPNENAMIESLMNNNQADPSKVKIVNIGEADFFTAVKRDIDFAWIYYGWTGIESELRKEPINMVYLTQYSKQLDFYTPVLATSEKMIGDKPELVKSFLAAASKGYQFAIDKPEEAAEVLSAAVPELDKNLVLASQKWLSPKYKDDAPRWGEQKKEVWENYAKWMQDYKLLEKGLDADKAYTNQFLPSGS
ncbi:ABC transporter substrate-binding protein [Paenibacillus sp. FJAT-26967]|uniref:ABC transporter substrate-binding protein n=1 Tax=Paenibacillus sp. FJAT-26967 TaxID=1729690 RepID=UPI0008398EC0|nr:ABC transporter substrate-binding protein [Paenibacillus sp. FJAT-26967]